MGGYDDGSNTNYDSSVSYKLHFAFPNRPFITHINMRDTNDCFGYIDKLSHFGTNDPSRKVLISASASGYANSTYVIDNIRKGSGWGIEDYSFAGYILDRATNALMGVGVPSGSIWYTNATETVAVSGGSTNYFDRNHLTGATNVAGYVCWGRHSSLGNSYATNATVQWTGDSGWWLIETFESYNGQRLSDMGHVLQWFSSYAFGGTEYNMTPIGAVSNVDEPRLDGLNEPSVYFPYWEAGKNFGIAAWLSRRTDRFQAVGDPFAKK